MSAASQAVYRRGGEGADGVLGGLFAGERGLRAGVHAGGVAAPVGCLTCPDYQTTPQFLQIHRQQAANNQQLIARADANGHERQAENLRRVQANLEKIIPALESLANETNPDDNAS